MRHIQNLGAAALLLAACTTSVETPRSTSTEAASFFQSLMALCQSSAGYLAYSGHVVSTDEVDADFAAEQLTAFFPSCSEQEVRIPFHVGADTSRTWVVTRTETGLRLKHDHRHEDGTEDAVSQYGGDTDGPGTATRQEFPVDAFSIALFEREGLTASVVNVWAMEVTDEIFAYELRRSNRFFRVEFDLTDPIAVLPTVETD